MSMRWQRRPRPDCLDAQSVQGLRCPLSESLGTIQCINGEQMSEWDLAHAQDDVNPHILRSLEGTTGRAKRKRVLEHRRTAKAQISLRIRAFWSGPSLSLTVALDIIECMNESKGPGLYFAHAQDDLTALCACSKARFAWHGSYTSLFYPKGTNVCSSNNGGCSGICIPTAGGGKKCIWYDQYIF